MNNNISIQENETIEDYTLRLCVNREAYGLSWNNVAGLINSESGTDYSADKYRKWYARKLNTIEAAPINDTVVINDPTEINPMEQLNSILLEINKAKVQMRDERTATNAYIRALSREDTIKEIAHDFACQMDSKKQLMPSKVKANSGDLEAVLMLSDWHYGITIDNFLNKYDTDICVKRVNTLLEKTLEFIKLYNINKVHIFDLSDLIAGRIHSQLRVESSEEVISQIMHVTELLAEFIAELSRHTTVYYYNCEDNHSRLEPDKKEALSKESLCRLTPWYLKERFAKFDNVIISDNAFGDDIICAEVNGHLFGGVHGDKDKVKTVVSNLSLHTRTAFKVICTAHLHHFSAEESHCCPVISNPSLMGTDSFANRLRLDSVPAQNLIIVSKDNPIYAINRIIVE